MKSESTRWTCARRRADHGPISAPGGCLWLLVRRPLDRVLAERRTRTTGAMEQARVPSRRPRPDGGVRRQAAQGAGEILTAREEKLKQWSAQRDQTLADARAATAEKVKAAKGEIEQSVAIAQLQIDGCVRS